MGVIPLWIIRKTEQSLIETLKTSNLSCLATNAGELALDAFLNDGLLKNIPILDSLQKLYKTGQSCRDYLFQKKLLKFLFSVRNISPDERRKFIEDLESNPGYGQKAGEQILLLLDRMDDMKKPEMMGKVIIAYIKDKIGFDERQRMFFAIDRLFLYDLSQLKKIYEVLKDELIFEENQVGLQNLVNCGLLNLNLGAGGGTYQNDLGKKFIEHVMQE